MATYAAIQEYARKKHGCTVKSCWMAHVKELNGLKPRVSHRRADPKKRAYPCPGKHRPMIEDAMRHFGMIE